ncbi:hypothetical protein CTA1_8577 [Colletotrichum tanaceti]|uniref:Uncharacterized protein n=1 Tax=Colletotrichum tanaceti TaxID=1306861 RepID=A0A4U6XA00_9PEZI|nr:hypothetical protein CTA1_8577 [Colletotrichum tanaceti]
MEKEVLLPEADEPQPDPVSQRSSYHDETDPADYNKAEAVSKPKRKPRHHGRVWWSTVAKMALLLPAAVVIFYLGRASHDVTTPTPTTPTPTTAGYPPEPVSLGKCSPDWEVSKARGCVYDFVLSTWMHPRCFNEDMHERYLGYMRWRNTTFWRERERIHEVPFDEAARGEHGEIFTDGTVHHMHCSYVWDRITYASHFSPRVLDSLCRDPKHVEHCILYNGIPQSWEIDLPNITRVYNEPHEVDCLVG